MKGKVGRLACLAGVATGALLYATSAGAIPTTTIDGVTVPVGILPGGNQIQSGILNESAVGAIGDTLSGIGIVSTIRQGLQQTWADGQNGVELAFAFDNFKVTAISNTSVAFSGGTVGFYVLPAGTNIAAGGSLGADIAIVQAGTLWLSESAVVNDLLGNTLLASGTDFLGSNFAGTGKAFFNVTGGDAAPNFHTQTFTTDIGGLADESFTSDFSEGSCTGGFQVCGSGTIKANAVPEPTTVGLFGVGLAALGAARRRKARR